MVKFNLGYRWPNGEIEGFSRTRFTVEAAESACHQAIKDKCQGIGVPYETNRVITSTAGLYGAELNRLKADWALDKGK